MSEAVGRQTRFNYRVAGVCVAGGYVLLHCWEACAFWALPGGRPELGETSRDALAREMMEETGLQVEVKRLLWIVENFYRDEGQRFHEIGFYYLMTLPEGCALANVAADFTGHEGAMEILFRWFLIDVLPETPLFPAFLRTALADLPTTPEHVVHMDSE